MKKTPLNSLHEKHGAKFGPFAGYDMPLFYKTGIISEHQHTRQSAGLFDISHMMPVRISGKQAANLVSQLCPLNAHEMPTGHSRYSFFLNEEGGIIDDLIVSRLGEDRYFIVCNAGCADKDLAHIHANAAPYEVEILRMDSGIVALQGPQSEAVLEDAGLAISDMEFMQIKELTGSFEGGLISRSGYTGEDGFEITLKAGDIARFSENLLGDERVKPIGLGARDSLRLEAGLSLYGQDLSDTITPMEAGLVWAIPKDLRNAGEYNGASAVAAKIAAKRKRKRVGIRPIGRAPVRGGSIIRDSSGANVGEITSGGFGPSVGHPVALGLINVDADTKSLVAEVRNKAIELEVVPLPFAPHQYKR